MAHAHRRPDPPSLENAARACVAAGECPPRAHTVKDTRRWCRGRVDTPHTWLWERDPDYYRFDDRWQRDRRVCFGCHKRAFAWRTRCRACGSPQRWIWTVLRASGYRAHRSEGPFCLCPENFNPCARLGDLWQSRKDPPVQWADDPAQIAALTARAKGGR